MKTNKDKTELQKLAESFVDEVVAMINEDHQTGDWWIDEMGEVRTMNGHMTREDTDSAMKDFGWKKMKSTKADENIEIETWNLKPEDLRKIEAGVRKIINHDSEDQFDKDKVIGSDKFVGPRLRITVKSKNKTYRDVPFAVLKRYLPSDLHNYDPKNVNEGNDKRCERCWNELNIPPQSVPKAVIQVKGKWLCRSCYDHWVNPQILKERKDDFHHYHKDYRMYEGYDSVVAAFEDNSRLRFEVHYHDKHGPDRDKWRRKALTCWKSLANEIHNDIELNEVGNPMEKSWKQSFQEALKHPKLQEFIRLPKHQRVFDPVNFTQIG